MASIPDMSINDFSEDIQEEYIEYHKQKYPNPGPRVEEPNELKFKIKNSVKTLVLHHRTLFNAMRGEGEIVQNATFGLRAAAPALAANLSYFEEKPVRWDAKKMKLS